MRYASIDVLRTLAIVIMVVVHFSENLSGTVLPVSGVGAPLFTFLSGVSYALWLHGQQQRGRNDRDIFKVSIRRGAFVFAVGIAFNVLLWLPEDTFNWDVLTFIGTALIVLAALRNAAPVIHVTLALASLFVAPLLRRVTEYPEYWLNKHYEYDFNLQEVLSGYFATGYFPVFPWLTFSLLGFVCGKLILANRSPMQFAIVGAVMFAATLPFRTSMYPATLAYVANSLGIAIGLLGLTRLLLDRTPSPNALSMPLRLTKAASRHAFTIYILHHVVHLWPLWIYGAQRNPDDPTIYWMNAMSFATSMWLAVAFLVTTAAALLWLGPNKNRGIEAAMRWFCD